MQVCTSLQTDNHANSVEALKANQSTEGIATVNMLKQHACIEYQSRLPDETGDRGVHCVGACKGNNGGKLEREEVVQLSH